MMEKHVPYGIMNYAELVGSKSYFVDKTHYIPALEQIRNPVFLRPKRFGKSLWCSILEHYYDLKYVDRFEELFGHTKIGQQPTASHNHYFTLSLDFSPIEVGRSLGDLEHNFKQQTNNLLDLLRVKYPDQLAQLPPMPLEEAVSNNLRKLFQFIKMSGLPPVYVIIDEYDNFANHLITTHQDHLYEQLMADDSFLKAFFKVLKEGRKSGAIANVFITGVLPMMIDELASGFNIASVITLEPEFEFLLGFTQSEVDTLLDEVYHDYGMDPASRSEVDTIIKTQYDGYHFLSADGEKLCNAGALMCFIEHFCQHKSLHEAMKHVHLQTEFPWLNRPADSTHLRLDELVKQLSEHHRIAYDGNLLRMPFDSSLLFEPECFPVSLYYLGMLTKHDEFFMTFPNVGMQQHFAEHFHVG